MKKFGTWFGAVIAGEVVAVVNWWFGLAQKAELAHVDWADAANAHVIFIASMIAFFLAIYLQFIQVTNLKKVVIFHFVAFILLIASCFGLMYLTEIASSKENFYFMSRIWQYVYTFMMIVCVELVLSASIWGIRSGISFD